MFLTPEEIDVLMDALKAWETKDFAGEMMGDIMETLLLDKKDENLKREVAIERAKQKEQREFEKRQRVEQSIMIQAKLIQLRRETENEQPNA